MRSLRLGLAQINSVVGDLNGNTEKIMEFVRKAELLEVDLLVFPELAITGSPPEGLLLNRQFIKQNIDCLKRIIRDTEGIALILGFADYYNGSVYNAAAVVVDNKLIAVSHKAHQSNLPIHDEINYFNTGTGCLHTVIRGHDIEIAIGEDVLDAIEIMSPRSVALPRLLININSNSYQIQDMYRQEDSFSTKAANNRIFIACANLVGAQDGLVFSGSSFILGADGKTFGRGMPFVEDMVVADLNLETSLPVKPPLPVNKALRISNIAAVYGSLVLGIKDYVNKNSFSKVVLGVSGGIDSSLVATIAAEALGAENVVGIYMPSRYSSTHSKTDVDKLVSNIGIELNVIFIEKAFCAYLDMLNLTIKENVPGITEQNLQARVRANILYALSNKYGWLVLSCGNKSEAATGYGTLYGDMAGGFTVLKDIYKTMVFELAGYKNSLIEGEMIPASVIAKEPSAELAPNQKDTDALPPYNVLDSILQAYMDRNIPVNEIVDMGYNKGIVDKVTYLVDKNEHKRRQSSPGVIISSDQIIKKGRLPISNRFRV